MSKRDWLSVRTWPWHRWALIGVLLVAVFFSFYRLNQEEYGNLYYAAAVKSMLTSWHNFFFVSFDPGGFVTVDKPPLGLWVQAASAALFGFNGLSLLLPQAVAGVLSVLLLYHLVRRTFGPTAGILAALILAVTPISVAANRNNTMDSLLVLTLLLAAWAALRAAETGRLRWLLLGMGLVGVGFNIKMLQAFLVLPAFYLLYLLSPPIPWWKRLLHLTGATALLLAVSFSWAIAVDLTPPEERPFVGSSKDNTVTELIIGHNGLSRLLPGGIRALTGPGGLFSSSDAPAVPPAAPPPGNLPPGPPPGGQPLPPPPPGGQPLPPPPGNRPPSPSGPGLPPGGRSGSASPPAQPPGRRGGGFSNEVGEPGSFRLLNQQLAGQISWLLPLAGLGLLAAAWQTRLRFPLTRKHQSLLFWAAWLAPMIGFFSVANLFHRDYLEMLSPAIGALAGAGLVALWVEYRREGWRGWLLPLALLGSALFEALIMADFPAWSRWLTPLVLAMSGAAAALLILRRRGGWLRTAAAAAGVLVLLIPMAVWAWIPVWYGGHAGLPYAGPELLTNSQHATIPESNRLVDFLLAHQGEATYLAATLNAQTAAPLILATGEPVMALGGFSGGDNILTTEELAGKVADGTVRFFLIPAQGDRQRDLTRWVVEHCSPVPDRMWKEGTPPQGMRLFDCGATG